MKTPKVVKPTIGQQLVERLKEFTEDLESGMELSTKYRVERVYGNLTPPLYKPGMVKKTRQMLNMHLEVFARFLGVSSKTVRAWEDGSRAPSEIARRFMDEIRHNPDYWRRRFEEIAAASSRA